MTGRLLIYCHGAADPVADASDRGVTEQIRAQDWAGATLGKMDLSRGQDWLGLKDICPAGGNRLVVTSY